MFQDYLDIRNKITRKSHILNTNFQTDLSISLRLGNET